MAALTYCLRSHSGAVMHVSDVRALIICLACVFLLVVTPSSIARAALKDRTDSDCAAAVTLTEINSYLRDAIAEACATPGAVPLSERLNKVVHKAASHLSALDVQQAATLMPLLRNHMPLSTVVHVPSFGDLEAGSDSAESHMPTLRAIPRTPFSVATLPPIPKFTTRADFETSMHPSGDHAAPCAEAATSVMDLVTAYDNTAAIRVPPLVRSWLQSHSACRSALNVPVGYTPLFLRIDQADLLEVLVIEPDRSHFLALDNDSKITMGGHDVALLSVPHNATVIVRTMLHDVHVPWVVHIIASEGRTLLDEPPEISCVLLDTEQSESVDMVFVGGEHAITSRIHLPTESYGVHAISCDSENECVLSRVFRIEAGNLRRTIASCSLVFVRTIGRQKIALVDSVIQGECEGFGVDASLATDAAKAFIGRNASSLKLTLEPLRDLDQSIAAVVRQTGREIPILDADMDPAQKRIRLLEEFRTRLWSTQVDMILVSYLECHPSAGDGGPLKVRYNLLTLQDIAASTLDTENQRTGSPIKEGVARFGEPSELTTAATKALADLFNTQVLEFVRSDKSPRRGLSISEHQIDFFTNAPLENIEADIYRIRSDWIFHMNTRIDRYCSQFDAEAPTESFINEGLAASENARRRSALYDATPVTWMERNDAANGTVFTDARWGVYLVVLKLSGKPKDAICISISSPNEVWGETVGVFGGLANNRTGARQRGLEMRVGYARFRPGKHRWLHEGRYKASVFGYGGTLGYRFISVAHEVAPTLDDTVSSANSPFSSSRNSIVFSPRAYARDPGLFPMLASVVIVYAGPVFDFGWLDLRGVPKDLEYFRRGSWASSKSGRFDFDLGVVAGLEVRFNVKRMNFGLGVELGSRQVAGWAQRYRFEVFRFVDPPNTAFDDYGLHAGVVLRVGGFQ